MYHCPWTYTPISQITRYSSHWNIIQNCLACQSTWVPLRVLVRFVKLSLFFLCSALYISVLFLADCSSIYGLPHWYLQTFLQLEYYCLNINFAPMVSQRIHLNRDFSISKSSVISSWSGSVTLHSKIIFCLFHFDDSRIVQHIKATYQYLFTIHILYIVI